VRRRLRLDAFVPDGSSGCCTLALPRARTFDEGHEHPGDRHQGDDHRSVESRQARADGDENEEDRLECEPNRWRRHAAH
jgi:hypothetical protein